MKCYFSILLLISLLFSFSNNDALKEYKAGHYKKAFNMWLKLSKQNNPKAIHNLAMMYYLGKGTQAKQDIAVKLLTKLIKNKDSYKLTKKDLSLIYQDLAFIYFYGYADKYNKIYIKRKEAKKFFKKSIELGNKKLINFYKKIYKDINATKK